MTNKINLDKIIIDLGNDKEKSLEDLFNHYYPRLYKFSFSFLKIDEGIDDILQVVFVKIWQNRKKISSAETFNAFIFTITRNLLLNELRTRLKNEKNKEEIKNYSLAQEYSSMDQIEYHDLKKNVDIIVNELPERQKQIFILSRKECLSHKEIAKKLGIKTKTVEYHITQSVKHLKEKLKGLGVISLLYFYLFF